MSDRPVYIPSRKRKQKKQFFHGAFTGGFSAGHFNTVADGSAEGFVPEEDENAIRRSQKPEDFMDDQDHNEWGGPTSVREEYAAALSNSSAAVKSDRMLDLVHPPAQNVGHRLLRILGWRDGSTAYVPREEKETVLVSPAGQPTLESLLSSRRLKKIQLQQKRVKLPPPKLDTCGLGYEPYENAPEFRAHRERRRKEAQERAKAVTASSAEKRNVYRLSNLLDNDEEDAEIRQFHTADRQDVDDPLVSYETEESFVGTKTVAGFALHEDDDDVYDDNVKVSKINRDEYDTVVYEHASEEEDNHTEGNGAGKDFGSVFASYATSKTSGESNTTFRGVTSDGKPPLRGFVLGASTTSKALERYPGPDLPYGYEPRRHEFSKDEYPNEWREESRTARLHLLGQRRKTIQEEQKIEIHKKEKERKIYPMASTTFAGLAAAMKNRFTSSAPETSENGGPAATGLHRPNKAATGAPLPPEPLPVPKPITITRTTMTFVPESLLCKRFHVVAPAHAKTTGVTAAEPKGEAAYFEKEIMSKAAAADVASASRAKETDGKKGRESVLKEDLLSYDGNAEESLADTRPSMKVLESIFEPESESSESEEEIEKTKAVPTGPKIQVSSALTRAAPATPSGNLDGASALAESALAAVRGDKEEKGRESEKRKDRRRGTRDDEDRKKRRKRRSRSSSPSSSSDRSRQRPSRKREEKKKRKKHHKSSRRSSSAH